MNDEDTWAYVVAEVQRIYPRYALRAQNLAAYYGRTPPSEAFDLLRQVEGFGAQVDRWLLGCALDYAGRGVFRGPPNMHPPTVAPAQQAFAEAYYLARVACPEGMYVATVHLPVELDDDGESYTYTVRFEYRPSRSLGGDS